MIYQLKSARFHANMPAKGGTFLEVASKIPYLAQLGVSASQCCDPGVSDESVGYTHDFFAEGISRRGRRSNAGCRGVQTDCRRERCALSREIGTGVEPVEGEVDRALHGLAIVLDLVYNMPGRLRDESLYFLVAVDRRRTRNSLYFTDKGLRADWCFDFGNRRCRLSDSPACSSESTAARLQARQVSVIDHDGAPHGWSFCQDLTSTLRAHRPRSFDKAEYWSVNPSIVKSPPEGAGFDTSLTDGLRIAIRQVISQASAPDDRPRDMTGLGRSLWPDGFAAHGIVRAGNHDVVYRIASSGFARLGDPAIRRGGRSAHESHGQQPTAPGMRVFMGQEFSRHAVVGHCAFHDTCAALAGSTW